MNVHAVRAGPSQEALVKLGAKDTEKIKDGQFWRLFTPIFLHVGIVRLLLSIKKFRKKNTRLLWSSLTV
jgi:hypothetical protein